MQTACWHIGLTGGIGSGKSTVAALLARRGAVHIDADALSRACTAQGGLAIDAIRAQFGSAMLTADGALDREAMRQHVFSNPGAKKQLESIIHPLVGQHIHDLAAEAERTGAHCIIYDLPLLVESGHWRSKLDRIWVVDCKESTQMKRVHHRSGLPMEQIQTIIASQASRSQRLAVADCVIYNDDIPLDALTNQVHALAACFGF
jgi:dephospho-CoA kinase